MTLATRSEVSTSTGKVKCLYASILKGNEIKPLIMISSTDFHSNRVFSLTWPTSMQIYWNNRKRLHEKRVELPEDWFGTPTWPPFHCFGTPIWPP